MNSFLISMSSAQRSFQQSHQQFSLSVSATAAATALNISLLSTLDCWGKLKNIVAELRGLRKRIHRMSHGKQLNPRYKDSSCSGCSGCSGRLLPLMMDCAESVLSSHARTLQIKVFKCRRCRRKTKDPGRCSIFAIKTLLLILHEPNLLVSKTIWVS